MVEKWKLVQTLNSAIFSAETARNMCHDHVNENNLPPCRMGTEVAQIGQAIGLLKFALASLEKGLPLE